MADFPWYKHWPEGVPKSLDYPDIPVQGLLTATAKRHPDVVATRFYGARLTYADLERRADALAGALAKIGVKRGDRVALLLPNCPQYPIAFFGALRAGAIVVNTNPLYTPRELVVQYTDAGAETVICADLFLKNVLKARKGTLVKRVVVTDIKEYLPFPLSALYPIKKKRDYGKIVVPEETWIHRLPSLLAEGASPTKPAVNAGQDVAVLQYTGGTTGTPKGAMLTHHNLVANALQTAAWLPDAKPGKEVFLSVIPFFHVYGLTTALLAPIRLAATMVIHANPREIPAILKLAHKTRPTIFPGVPTMYVAIINRPDVRKYDLRSIKACISGSAPLAPEVRKKFEQLTGGKLVEGYGLTEASPVTHANPLYGLIKDAIGIPFPDTEARIVDAETGAKVLGVGEVGELTLRGPQVMKGYWGKREETAAVLRDGWLRTGDIARMDEDGYFFIVERKKDVIICSGYNVYPREVEEVLFEHPAVQEAAVIGIPDPYRGESVKAFLVLKAGRKVTADEVRAFCKDRLAPFKVPREVEFRKELPKTIVGKVLRRALREAPPSGSPSPK
ncbi:MAG TPA: long-chain fatty acid--CoA ligase [Thermoplasmata archaeon]|nr:long-chain fatty acid--CoA ligase [Thermoplasmata archaeon]